METEIKNRELFVFERIFFDDDFDDDDNDSDDDSDRDDEGW